VSENVRYRSESVVVAGDAWRHHGFMNDSSVTALLVIDVQESFRHRPYWDTASADDLERFLVAQNRLIAGATGLGMPIVRVLHVDEDPAGNPFDPWSGFVRPLEGLVAFDAALKVNKSRHSALVGTGLSEWLRQRSVGRVIISGIRTEQCCETTARHASDEGYHVEFVSEATLTFAMLHADGTVSTPAEIRQRTETVLRDRFADIVTVDEALRSAASSPSAAVTAA
jgi:nicotinamidase-related amidase